MKNEVKQQDFFVEPGYVYLPAIATQLYSVVTSGVSVTIYDTKRKLGGMGHYVSPYRRDGLSTAMFAAPAIMALAQMFFETGSSRSDLEAHFCGGAVNPDAANYVGGLSEENVTVGLEILSKLKISIAGKDVGGRRARKIAFHTGTGEIMVAKVDTVRSTDWYPAS